MRAETNSQSTHFIGYISQWGPYCVDVLRSSTHIDNIIMSSGEISLAYCTEPFVMISKRLFTKEFIKKAYDMISI